MVAMPVSEDLAIVIQELDANVSHLETITAGLSREQFNWRPEPGQWSIGECVNHLNIVNSADLAPLREAIELGRARGRMGEGPFQYGVLSRKFIADMEAPVKRRFKAPKSYLPPPDAEPRSTIDEYRRISMELRRLALSADGLHLRRVKTTLPVLPPALRWLVRMPLGARLALLTTHDRRHLWQAEQVRLNERFPTAG